MIRPPVHGDLGAVAALFAAADAAIGVDTGFREPEIEQEWRGLDLDRDAWLAEEDGRPVGHAYVRLRPGRAHAVGVVHPEETGRGIGTELVRLSEERARELGADAIRHVVVEGDEAAALLAGRGYGRVRTYLRLAADLEDEPAPAEPPPGIRIERFRLADAAAVHAALDEAFEDEWQASPRAFEEWWSRRLAAPGADPTLWFTAREGDAVVGAVVCESSLFGAAWIAEIGVRRPWRGRGVASALLRAAFGELHRRGRRRVTLSVDAENPSGAVRVYTRAGMRPIWALELHERGLG